MELTVLDPRTGETVTRIPLAGPAECDAAIGRARRAFPQWARTPAAERAAALSAAADAVASAAEELADWNERETGKPHDDALGGVEAAVGTLRQYAQLGPVHRGRSLLGGWGSTDLMLPEPRGVVALLTPWNDPIAVAAGLIGAAVVTGNTVVHKPSERCPGTGRRFADLVASCLPDGVLETVDGDAAAGARLAEAPDVDVVAHVGSSTTGRAIARVCADRGAKALLENGGNDALIVDDGVAPAWRRKRPPPAPSPTPGRSVSPWSASMWWPRRPTHSSARSPTRRGAGRTGSVRSSTNGIATTCTVMSPTRWPAARGRWWAASRGRGPERSIRPPC